VQLVKVEQGDAFILVSFSITASKVKLAAD
jgi:hypothetical protein